MLGHGLPVLFPRRQLRAQFERECDRADFVVVNLLNGLEYLGDLQTRFAINERLIEDKSAKSQRMPWLEVGDEP